MRSLKRQTHRKGHTLEATEGAVFSVASRHGPTTFCLGFCEAFITLPELVIPIKAFRRTRVHVTFGEIECRAVWNAPCGMERLRHELSLHPWQQWMSLNLEVVLQAVFVCEEAAIELPTDGFKRRFG